MNMAGFHILTAERRGPGVPVRAGGAPGRLRGARVLRWLAGLIVAIGAPANAANLPGFGPMVTDSFAVFGIPSLAEPMYLSPMRDPVFGTWVLRIAADGGAPLAPLTGQWSEVSRHVYSKQQPWNADLTLLSIRNVGSGTSPLLLDGSTYLPVRGPCPNYDRWDYRWHPSILHANEQINVNRAGTELMWFDVMRCTKTRSWPLPIVADYGIGSGEGNVSADGRYVAIANQHQVVVVDMDPGPPSAPEWPYVRIGPVFTFPPCSLDVTRPELGRIDHVSISPSGRYITVKYAGLAAEGAAACDTLCDMHRVFEVDSALVIRPHTMDVSALRCGSFAARTDGWLFPLKHADLAIDPFDAGEDVLIGGRACPGSRLGHVVKVRLRDGLVTPLTSPVNEASYSHGSARNTHRLGWFYVTFSGDSALSGTRFWGETVAVKMDGSGKVQRFAHYHSTQASYDSEAQSVPSPDGRRVLFASDWRTHCTSCGTPNSAKSYVVDARANPLAGADDTAAPALLRLSLRPAGIPGGAWRARFSLHDGHEARLEIFDVAGRRLLRHEVRAVGTGPQELELGASLFPDSGIYFVRLREGGASIAARIVVLR